MRAGESCTSDERDALQRAIHAANGALAKLWEQDKNKPKWFIAYVELNAEIPVAGELIISDRNFITANAETPEYAE